MSNQRKITFGKYKGKTIIELIATHIGYIMWCLNNVKQFYLTEEEQTLYDALAISIIRDKVPMTFPIEGLKDFIKDTKALENLESPFINTSSNTYLNLEEASQKLKEVYSKYRHILTPKSSQTKTLDYLSLMSDLFHEVQWCENFFNDSLEDLPDF